MLVITAKRDTPIAGEKSSSRDGIDSDGSSMARNTCRSASGAPVE